MNIEKFRHKGLKWLYEDDAPSGVPATAVRKIRAILAALEFASELSQVDTMPGCRLHPLKGGCQGEYAITVTGNWRITFRLERSTITAVNFEDYH